MPLEGGNFIHQLDRTWPLASDPVSAGDDHIRLIKRALYGTGPGGTTGTFRKFTGPIELSSDEINALPTDIAAVQTSVNDEVTELLKHVVPKGAIQMWSGSIGNIPTGWEICDGANDANGDPKPDLRNRFIIGAGSTYAVGATGGQLGGTTGAGGSHSHGGTTGSHSLTKAELPANLTVNVTLDASGQSDNHTQTSTVARGRNATGTDHGVASVVGTAGDAHSHTISASGDHTHTNPLPAYFALAFIIKVSEYVAP